MHVEAVKHLVLVQHIAIRWIEEIQRLPNFEPHRKLIRRLRQRTQDHALNVVFLDVALITTLEPAAMHKADTPHAYTPRSEIGRSDTEIWPLPLYVNRRTLDDVNDIASDFQTWPASIHDKSVSKRRDRCDERQRCYEVSRIHFFS